MFNQSNQQQCRKFWQLARTITPSDLIALWCNQEPSEFNAFLANTGYLPSCADAKKALLLEALENKELDYIDDGLPYNGGLWIGGNIAELLAKNRIRLDKDKAKTWIISLHEKGNLGGLPNFLLDDLNATTADDDSQQQIADLQAENAHLKAQIAELESELNQANTTPAIKHTNTALQALHDVLVTHWQDYDPSQSKTRPKQDFIKAWIVENYPEIEPSKALWIDKIIRHGTHD